MNVVRASRFQRDAVKISRTMEDAAVALRFFDAVEELATQLGHHPFLGRERPEFGVGRRSWGVPGFRKWVVFYRIQHDSLQLQRVIHDLPQVLRSS